MSIEEIINAWKSNEEDPNKLAKDKKLRGKLRRKGKMPANPAGEQEITDEDLKAVEGGISRNTCSIQEC